jgi:hypothetical protein
MTGDELTYVYLLDGDGNILDGPVDMGTYDAKISANDDWETLDGGNVVWSWVEDDGTLKVAILPVPE